jgi:hypothetical protein
MKCKAKSSVFVGEKHETVAICNNSPFIFFQKVLLQCSFVTLLWKSCVNREDFEEPGAMLVGILINL